MGQILTLLGILSGVDVNDIRLIVDRYRIVEPITEGMMGPVYQGVDEKTLFTRLAVFLGGRTPAAIKAVCGHGLKFDVLDGLESLFNKSLLFQEEGLDREPCFILLDTIHHYACERLAESGDTEDIQQRHTGHFIALAERAEPELRGPKQEYWSACWPSQAAIIDRAKSGMVKHQPLPFRCWSDPLPMRSRERGVRGLSQGFGIVRLRPICRPAYVPYASLLYNWGTVN